MTLAFAALTSCSDDNSVDLSNRKFVRIDQSPVAVGKTVIKVETADGKLCYFSDLTVTKTPKTCYIDFGVIDSPAPFNNYRNPRDPGLVNMLDHRGRPTTFGI